MLALKPSETGRGIRLGAVVIEADEPCFPALRVPLGFGPAYLTAHDAAVTRRLCPACPARGRADDAGMRLPLILVLVVAMFSTAACSGGDKKDARMQATLTDDGCTYVGETEVAAGSFQIDVRNLTQHGASFHLARLANDYTAATIKPILAKETAWGRSLTKTELRDLPEGKLPLQHPRPDLPQIFDFRQGDSATIIGAGESSVLPGVGVSSGAFALICRINLLRNFIHREQYVASQIDVTGALPGVTTP